MVSHRVLIVGVGSIGERHLRCFGHTGRAELSLCEVNETLRHEVAQRYGVARVYGQLKDALAEPHDAVVICTPAQLHIPMALASAEVGLHMLIEKPLSTSLQDVDRLQAVLAERGLVAAVAYVWRTNPTLQAVKAALASGRFGAPKHVSVVTGQHFPTGRPAYREIYYTDRATGGGAIQDALTHMFNACEYLVGPIDRLAADADHQVLEGVTVEDTVDVIARHGAVMASYSLNQFQAPNCLAITIACDGGTLQVDVLQNRWQWMVEPATQWHEEQLAPTERDDGFVCQANVFLDAVEGKAEPLCTLAEGAQTLKANLAALKAAETGTWQTIERTPTWAR